MKLFDTLSKSKKELPSPDQQKVLTLYTCGPTVYDETHIGHMRKYSMDDILKRSLRYMGYEVRHVMNITDVGHLTGDDDSGEDKLERGAKKFKKSVWDLACEYEAKFWETISALHIDKKDITVLHATKCVPDMIALIKTLVKKGYTYETREALYFDTTTFNSYGALSGQDLSEKKQAVRSEVNIDPGKKHPADFALWFKRVGRFADHSMHWESPWGDGFPGWHIECSAMSMKEFGPTVDIHTGGVDHIPVHHENERAQSEAATGNEFVRWWVHHAFLKVDGEKMSKSKGNFYTLADLRKKGIDPLAIKYLFLQTHYRKSLNFTWEAAQSAQKLLARLRTCVASTADEKVIYQHNILGDEYKTRFIEALSDDLNTAVALSVVWGVVNSDLSPSTKRELLLDFDRVLGLGLSQTVPGPEGENIPEHITRLADEREKARTGGDFAKSDTLRTQIEEEGYHVQDGPNGYVIKKIT